jgi:hypothetical protein
MFFFGGGGGEEEEGEEEGKGREGKVGLTNKMEGKQTKTHQGKDPSLSQ